MSNSLLKTLNRYNFSKHPIKAVRDRMAFPKQNMVKMYNEAKKETAEQTGNATKPDEELAKVVLPILESAGINPDNVKATNAESNKTAWYDRVFNSDTPIKAEQEVYRLTDNTQSLNLPYEKFIKSARNNIKSNYDKYSLKRNFGKINVAEEPMWTRYKSLHNSSDDNILVKQINQLVNDYSYTDLLLAEKEMNSKYIALVNETDYSADGSSKNDYHNNLIYQYYVISEARKIKENYKTEKEQIVIRTNEIFKDIDVGDLYGTYGADTALEKLVERKISADENYNNALNGSLVGMAGDGTAIDEDERIVNDAKIEAEASEYALLLYVDYLAENYTLSYLYQMYLSAESKLGADSLEHPGNLTEAYGEEQLLNQKSMPIVMSMLKDAFYIRKETHPDDEVYSELKYIYKHMGLSMENIDKNLKNTTDFVWGLISFDLDSSHKRIADRSKALKEKAQDIESKAPLSRGLGAMRMIGQLPEQAPQVVLTAINPVAGLAYSGVNSFGSAYGDAAASGADIKESTAYGIMNAAIEVALEKFMGDKVFGGESILGRKMSKFIGKTVSSPVARGVIGYIADSVGEGAEEVIATAISPYIQKIAGVEVDSPEFDDYVNNFVAGMFNSIVYGGASRIGHLYTNSNGTSFKSDINNDLAMPQYKTAEDTTAEVATGIKTPENDTEVNYTDYVNDETLNVGFSEILNNTDVNYDVDLAISNILKGRATDVDFDFFVLKNKANRQAFYETTGIKLPEDAKLSNYILNALNGKEKRIRDIYLKHNTNSLKQPDSLTPNDEGGIINEKSSLSLKEFSYVKEKTGWSDDVISYIRTLEEAEVYINAGLKEVQLGDHVALVRSDIDLEQVDSEGITNRERMSKGMAPYAKNGEKIELHHIGQENNSPLAELTWTEHRGKGQHGKLHNLKKKSKVDHKSFSGDRNEYWKERVDYLE